MRIARVVRLAATCVSLALAVSADADQIVAPTAIRPLSIVGLTTPWTSTLRRIAATGDSRRLVQTAFEALDDLRRAGIGDGCCDPAKDYFLVTFVGADPTGAPTLITVLAHDPMPATVALPGVHGAGQPLYEVFLSDDLTSSLQTTYTITHEENPAARQTGAFAAAIIGNIALPLATRTYAPAANPPAGPAARFDVAVAFSRVVLPETGAIALHQTVTSIHPIGHLAARVAAVNRDQQTALQARDQSEGALAACADLSTILKGRIDTSTAGTACGLWPADLAACTKAVREDLDRTASTYFSTAPPCPIDAGAPLVQEYLSVIQDVKPIASTIAIGNAPLIRYGFGLAAGYIAHIDADAAHPRARLQGGRIVADPFARQLTMGVVNLTPWGYDPQRQSPALAERARLVAGVAFSPYFGVTAGGAFEVNRYLAVNAGYARLWFDTPKAGEQIGAAPTATNNAAPFVLRSTGALFFGVSYNFK
ncbi:MAG TPA: hypothetical protein VG222_10735 [Vicinamibacterales bacterium]|jgi:hypothetical protein|nr:hypothetical protein [Vicinamibacterales bacterium]